MEPSTPFRHRAARRTFERPGRLRYGLRFRPEGLPRRMHRPEKLISVTKICAYTIYNRRAFEFRKLLRFGTYGKAILLRLNSRLQSLIGFSSFLDRKSKVRHGISYFPRRKSQVPSAFRTFHGKSPNSAQLSHFPRGGSQNRIAFRIFHVENHKIPSAFALSIRKIGNSARDLEFSV